MPPLAPRGGRAPSTPGLGKHPRSTRSVTAAIVRRSEMSDTVPRHHRAQIPLCPARDPYLRAIMREAGAYSRGATECAA